MTAPTIPRRTTHSPVRASFAQERLWFVEGFGAGTAVYNQLNGIRLRGDLDLEVLERSLREIVRRHEALRTNLVLHEGTLLQVIHDSPPFELPVVDLSDRPDSQAEAAARAVAIEAGRRPLDLAAEPLLRATLLRLSAQDHILALGTHHTIFDGWSVSVVTSELGALYGAFARGDPSPLPDLPIQYADWALWQRERFERGEFDGQLRYWQERLAGVPPFLDLPTDRPRPPVQSFEGAVHTSVLPASVGDALRALGRGHGATLFMTLLAAFDVLLLRYTHQDDIVVGCPIAGRTWRETEGLVGLFVNTLALRADLSGDPSFAELLRVVRRTALEAYTNQDLPFEKLVEALEPQRALNRSPIFQAAFQLRNVPVVRIQLPGVALETYQFGELSAKLDLSFDLVEKPEGLVTNIAYSTHLFDEATIARMADHWRTLLEGIVANPEQRVSTLPLLTPQERQQILVEWNQTRTDYPRDASVHQLFEQQAARTPDALAVVHGSESWTYRELSERANQLAWRLRDLGIEDESLVGLCMERCVEMVAGMLAILKAGGAYVPVDPADPPERVAFMLQDAGASVVVTRERYRDLLSGVGAQVICIDAESDSLAGLSRANPPAAGSADSLAYVTYTSGSTGTPKGVCIIHRGIVRLVRNTDYVAITSEDTLPYMSHPAFDAATFEVWGALLNGGRLEVIDREILLSPRRFADALEAKGITVLFMGPSLFRAVVGEVPTAFGRVRTLLLGGEVVGPGPVREVLRHGSPRCLGNAYGPTENTTFSTCHIFTSLAEDARTIPIGHPIANSQAYILGRNLQPVPVGVTGEIYVGGDGVARGYHRRPELTEAVFIPDPFSDRPEARLYRTGDLGRYLPDGNIGFLGRADHQVKVRGFRVEPGEVEVALAQHPAVRQAVVTAAQDPAGGARLIAYVQPNEGSQVDAHQLRRFLRNRLPEYMVPAAFMSLPSIPLTPSGKVDRRALPPVAGVRADQDAQPAAARDAFEESLAAIWERVLGVTPVGVCDDFFDLGGHSLLAVRLMAEIERAFGVSLPLSTLFQAPTVEQLASVLREPRWPSTWRCLVPVRPGSEWPPLFCIHAPGGEVLAYRALLPHLDPDRPVYGLQARGLDGVEEPFATVEEMAAHYIGEIQAVQPHGPYALLGFCAGGVTAFEMAQRLAAAGEQVGLLALVDVAPPNCGYRSLWPLLHPRRARRFWAVARERFRRFVRKDRQAKLESIRALGRGLERHVEDSLWVVCNLLGMRRRQMPRPPREPDGLDPTHRRLRQAHWQATQRYRPNPYPGRALLFRAREQPLLISHDPEMGWGKLARGGVEVVEFAGTHGQSLQGPHAGIVGAEVRRRLAQFSQPGQPAANPPG
jgi:amino acid adenylation domain-containing protein